LREIEHASSVRRFAADLNIELIFSRVERILEINELHTVTKEVVEKASRRVAKTLVYCDKRGVSAAPMMDSSQTLPIST
jgi:hypothetical protein